MFNKIIDKSIVIVRYNNVDFKYHKVLNIKMAMRLAKIVSQANKINYKKYWVAIDKTKILMMKFDKDKNLIEYNPSFKKFDKEYVRNFVSKGKMPFGTRVAHWRALKDKIVCISGCFINAKLSTLSKEEMKNLYNAMESYNASVKADVESGKYAIGNTFLRFEDVMTA